MTRRLTGFLIGMSVMLVSFLFARSAGAVTLIPPSLEFVDVDPGETVTSKIKLYNETGEPLTLYTSTANFTALDETGTPKILVDGPKEDLASWITVAPGPFTVIPNERVEIPFSITLPSDATPGGHFASILVSPNPPESAGESQIAIGQKVGTLILVRISGVINESGAIEEFGTVGGKSRFNRLPIDFTLRVENRGNAHLRPAGTLTIRNMLGGTSTEIPLNAGRGAILPQSIRKFDVRWERGAGSESASGNFFQEIGAEWRNFGFGSYTANLALTYGQNDEKSLAATVEFWVFPWRVLLLSFIVIVLFILLIVFLIRRYNHWIVAKAAKDAKK